MSDELRFRAFDTKVAFHLPDTRDHIQKQILSKQAFYEQPMLEDIGPGVPENALVVDAGANIGNHTVFFAKILKAKVLAFEPNPAAIPTLQRNIEINEIKDRVDLHTVALGQSSGTGTISNSSSNNLGMTQVIADDGGEVAISSLDDIIGDRAVQLIKIDVEGMECDVLKGAIGTLKRSHPALLIKAATIDALASIEAILRPLGYRKVKVYNDTPTYLFKYTDPAYYTDKTALSAIPADVREKLPLTKGIYAGMATVVGNEAALRATIMSLLPQIDRLYLYLNGFQEVPAFIKEHKKITCFIDEDGKKYGDAGKFWGLEQVEDAVYLTCDDDIIYPADFVERMVGELALTNGIGAHCVHGSLLIQPSTGYYTEDSRAVFHFQQGLIRRRLVHVAATNACIFHSSVVKTKLSDFRYPNMADIWLAQYLLNSGIPSYVIPRPSGWLVPIKVNRPTIYEQSTLGAGDIYDSSKRQDKILSGMYPVSLLQTVPSVPVVVLDADESEDVVKSLANTDLDNRDAVFIVMCQKIPKGMQGLLVRKGIKNEVHFLTKNKPIAKQYQSLFGGSGLRIGL